VDKLNQYIKWYPNLDGILLADLLMRYGLYQDESKMMWAIKEGKVSVNDAIVSNPYMGLHYDHITSCKNKSILDANCVPIIWVYPLFGKLGLNIGCAFGITVEWVLHEIPSCIYWQSWVSSLRDSNHADAEMEMAIQEVIGFEMNS